MTKILLPKLGFSVTEATLAEWFVKDGDHVEEGKPLFSVESDKSVQEVAAPTSGVLSINKEAGEVYEIGTVLGELK